MAGRGHLGWTLAVFVLVGCATAHLGCQPFVAASAAGATRAAVPAAVDETLNTLDDAGTRTRIADVMGTPEMQRAMAELGAAAAQGIMQDVSSERTDARLTALTGLLTEAFTRALAKRMAEQERALLGAVEVATTTATHAAMSAAADDMRSSFGPAVRESLVAALRSPDLRASLDETVVDATVSAKTAMNGGELPERPLLTRLQNLITFAWCIAAAALVALAAFAVRALRGRGRRTEVQRRAIAEELVGHAIEASKGKPWSDELRQLLTGELADRATADRRKA